MFDNLDKSRRHREVQQVRPESEPVSGRPRHGGGSKIRRREQGPGDQPAGAAPHR
jgi:hypothetical protein